MLTHDSLPGHGLDFSDRLPAPLRVRALELVRNAAGVHLMRLQTQDGRTGLYPAQERVVQVVSFVQQVLAPAMQDLDLRDWTAFAEAFHRKHYKVAGLPFWACLATAEVLALDLLGRAAGVPVVELLGGVKGPRQIDIYLSSRDRINTPEEEVAMMQQRIAETGARAIKLGIGGRMSRNVDAWPGRSEALISHARRTLGDGITIYADANGSYDAPAAIEVGAMLVAHGVAMFEEPCPFDDFEMTAQVTHALQGITVSAGESEHSMPVFRWLCQNHAVDVLQPDLLWAGGLLRCLRVAQLAAQAGIPIVPHSPRAGIEQAALLHYLAAIPNAGAFHEYKAAPHTLKWACDHELLLDAQGRLSLPDGPGLGMAIDPKSLGPLTVVA
jgi:D-galactarolactone cycloisomerase